MDLVVSEQPGRGDTTLGAKDKLTDARLKAGKPKHTLQNLADGGGLYLYVTPAGAKLWRVRYRFAGKQRLDSPSPYPTVSLSAARKRHDEVQALLVAGIDPAVAKKATRAAAAAPDNSSESVARECLAQMKASWVPRHAERVASQLARHVFRYIRRRRGQRCGRARSAGGRQTRPQAWA